MPIFTGRTRTIPPHPRAKDSEVTRHIRNAFSNPPPSSFTVRCQPCAGATKFKLKLQTRCWQMKNTFRPDTRRREYSTLSILTPDTFPRDWEPMVGYVTPWKSPGVHALEAGFKMFQAFGVFEFGYSDQVIVVYLSEGLALILS